MSFSPLTCCHVTNQQIVTLHQSMSCHRSVYVNSVVNSNMDSIIHVNNVIFLLCLS
ncbi:hypothetical protein CUMW_248050 [Citrus unshiu]|uniref:Uncharacterized protein n=1 Tax=Citrus unshiu TaxID=55188 RepID=A0A2H5QP15_CITUN|nr:hypothetical protein CUMW_248050 [Citrus unshiu]